MPLTHEPDEHTSPPPQVVHIDPPAPHLMADGVCTHVAPSQQPPQFAGEHIGGITHAPATQVWLLAHWAHTPASEPHARFELPGVQAPASVRQPGQVKVMHWPMVLQALFWAWQFWHATPPWPHAVKVLPPRHAPLSQQPLQLAHNAAPPALPPPAPPALPPAAPPPVIPAMHTPAAHAWPGIHAEQVRPSAPQANAAVPLWHSSF